MANFNATKGSPTANSYATVDEADEYLENEYGADEWAPLNTSDSRVSEAMHPISSGLPDEVKEKLLVTATRMIERLKPKYKKFDKSQSLNFPMSVSPDGFDIAKEATIIQAMHLYRNHEQIQEALSGTLHGLKKESLGKTSKEVTAYNPMGKYAPGVLRMLSNYVEIAVRCTR